MSGFDRWIGKVAIVTGASSGIGADIAKQLTERGLKVAGLARRSERVEELAKTLHAAPGKLHAIKCDVSNEEDILSAFKWVRDNLGPVSILINNAGIVQNTNLIDGDTQKWKKVMDVNVIGVLIGVREAVKIMKEENIDGHIININSVAGHYDFYSSFINVYPASKHAITNLTETLRKEFNANNLKIKITSVSPGYVNTDIMVNNDISLPDIPEIYKRAALEAEDISEAIIYALSTKPHVQIHEIMVRPVGEAF